MRFIITLLLLVTLTGCVSAPENHTASITNLEKVGNYHGIVDHYRKQLATKPNNPKIMLKLADAYCHLGDIESAQFYISQLNSPRLQNAEYFYISANINMAAEQYRSAIKNYNLAIKRNINNPEVFINQGIAYGYLNKYQQAESAFNQARLHGYDENIVKNNLATLKIAQNKNQQAVDILSPVYLNEPKNKTIAFNLAIALIRTDHEIQAREILLTHYSQAETIQLLSTLKSQKA
ncbi:tetratricopeptide repeat protein [Photobacterium leiognathi]|uniref:tetratricopeptide repeat protein n=1 Tax=Photobacterium leiognathi TaxID=553611 RepID=UPI0029828695|nr:tetratricopeptide repeat protein [Photobacterium leiognathi]